MKKIYLTKKGLKRIKKECEELQKAIANKLKDGAPEALESDELNPEYQSFQEELGWQRTRLDELKYTIKHAKEIKNPPQEKQNIIDIGAIVLVESKGKTHQFEILGGLEVNPGLGKISNESPVGKALLGKKVGDVITVSFSSKTIYKIKKIRYPSRS